LVVKLCSKLRSALFFRWVFSLYPQLWDAFDLLILSDTNMST
jgi:hypothetical protein